MLSEIERAELAALARAIEAQDAPVGRLFARLIAHLPGEIPAGAGVEPLPVPASAQEGAK